MSEHENSRKITIFRSGSYLSRAQGPQVMEYLAMAKVSVGSYYMKNSTKVASGMTFGEEQLLMPEIIDTPPEDKEFRTKMTAWLANIDTKIDYETGTVLEIGLESDNSKPVSKDNMPLNITDFVRWRIARGHPYMAANKEEADSNANKQYYIFDKEETQKKSINKSKSRDAAIQLYLQLKVDMSKVDTMLTLMSIDPRNFSGPSKDDLKIEALHKLANDKPDDFIKEYKAGHLEVRYWIQSLLNTGVYKKLGDKYKDVEGDKIVANSTEELIAWFEDDENSDSVIVIKSRMQEALKNPVKNPVRKTQLN